MQAIGTPDSQLAYEDKTFLTSEDARPLRIIAEYLEPLQRFRRAHIHDTIVFFGSARLAPDGPMQRYYQQARELARLLTVWSKALSPHAHRYVVCSGGGGVARAVVYNEDFGEGEACLVQILDDPVERGGKALLFVVRGNYD